MSATGQGTVTVGHGRRARPEYPKTGEPALNRARDARRPADPLPAPAPIGALRPETPTTRAMTDNLALFDTVIEDLGGQVARLTERIDMILMPQTKDDRGFPPASEACSFAGRQAEQFRKLYSLARDLEEVTGRIAL